MKTKHVIFGLLLAFLAIGCSTEEILDDVMIDNIEQAQKGNPCEYYDIIVYYKNLVPVPTSNPYGPHLTQNYNNAINIRNESIQNMIYYGNGCAKYNIPNTPALQYSAGLGKFYETWQLSRLFVPAGGGLITQVEVPEDAEDTF